jgi:adenosylcobyric acid synthase
VPVTGTAPIDGATGTATGYEIHMGRTSHATAVDRPLGERSASTGYVLGTYLHGLFENENVRRAFCESAFLSADASRSFEPGESDSPYADAADLVADIDLPFDLSV